MEDDGDGPDQDAAPDVVGVERGEEGRQDEQQQQRQLQAAAAAAAPFHTLCDIDTIKRQMEVRVAKAHAARAAVEAEAAAAAAAADSAGAGSRRMPARLFWRHFNGRLRLCCLYIPKGESLGHVLMCTVCSAGAVSCTYGALCDCTVIVL